ncbi:MAG: hypothetical protein KDA72_11505 [Planctomycetales bacterium]|nr:hypothetical protein [Planctomycetales bacterium]
MKSYVFLVLSCLAVVLSSFGSRRSFAEELAIDLSTDGAAERWMFLDPTATIHDSELVLDGRQAMSRAFYLPA